MDSEGVLYKRDTAQLKTKAVLISLISRRTELRDVVNAMVFRVLV